MAVVQRVEDDDARDKKGALAKQGKDLLAMSVDQIMVRAGVTWVSVLLLARLLPATWCLVLLFC